MNATPHIGDIIHVSTDLGCIPAIVTGNIVPVTAGSATIIGHDFSATAFSPFGAASEAARRIFIGGNTPYHAPDRCGDATPNLDAIADIGAEPGPICIYGVVGCVVRGDTHHIDIGGAPEHSLGEDFESV